MSGNIGGALYYEALAMKHRPRTAEEIRSAILELRQRNYGDYEISSATVLSVEMVRRLLGPQCETCEE